MIISRIDTAGRFVVSLLLFGIAFGISSCASTSPTREWDEQLAGVASYYAEDFHGRRTSAGEIYDMNALTAAHRTLPFNSMVRVINLDNNRRVDVRINDRGPFKDNRIIDVSFRAAMDLGLIAKGTAPVRLDILELGPISVK